uniref:Uncharacterized protein n=1 Tax=Clastoptera arizonana TaxID=38151 RepID=A0A1B6CLN6_9HEMI
MKMLLLILYAILEIEHGSSGVWYPKSLEERFKAIFPLRRSSPPWKTRPPTTTKPPVIRTMDKLEMNARYFVLEKAIEELVQISKYELSTNLERHFAFDKVIREEYAFCKYLSGLLKKRKFLCKKAEEHVPRLMAVIDFRNSCHDIALVSKIRKDILIGRLIYDLHVDIGEKDVLNMDLEMLEEFHSGLINMQNSFLPREYKPTESEERILELFMFLNHKRF